MMPDVAPRAAVLPDALAAAQREIEETLDALLPPATGPGDQLFAAMRHVATGGGKRMRGFLVLEGARLFGVAREAALRAASAVEMLHAYSLAHDDLPSMDDDDLRRGRPTAHKVWDDATAILAGDALQAESFAVLADPDTHADPAVRAELCLALARAAGAHGMCGGQMLDMLAEGAGAPPDAAAVARIQLLKTGKLIEFSAEAGAILGRASRDGRTALRGYGHDLGTAFQIADDLLDATATAAETGKRTGKDANAGKATLVGLLGPERARAQAERLVAQAKAHLEGLAADTDLLAQLADYAVARRA